MPTLAITIKPKSQNIFSVEMNADKLEKLAANLGFFSEKFLESIERAEEDEKTGKIRNLKSLKDLRRN